MIQKVALVVCTIPIWGPVLCAVLWLLTEGVRLWSWIERAVAYIPY